MGVVLSLWLKRFKRGPMDRVLFAEAVAGRGLAGNANQGGRRQVTLIDEARWREALEALGVDVDPSTRRANVLLSGIDLEGQRGHSLRLGQAVIRIYNELTPCHQMDEAQPGLRKALKPRWRGGAFGEVIEGGIIHVGDPVEWLS